MGKVCCKLEFSKKNSFIINSNLEVQEKFIIFNQIIEQFGDWIKDELKKMYNNKKFFIKKTKTKDEGEIWEYNVHILTDGELQEIKDQEYIKGKNDVEPFMR